MRICKHGHGFLYRVHKGFTRTKNARPSASLFSFYAHVQEVWERGCMDTVQLDKHQRQKEGKN